MYSHAFISRLNTGVFPHGFYKAERLIITTERTISEIAMICGFSDMSHFARTFRERKGMTPTERRRAREN